MVRIYNVSDVTSTILLRMTGPEPFSGKNFYNFRHINKIWRKPATPRKEKPIDLQLLHTPDWENLARHRMSRLSNNAAFKQSIAIEMIPPERIITNEPCGGSKQSLHGTSVAHGSAIEKIMPDGIAYRDWAGGIVRDELHKAGWRSADLLEQILK